MKDSPKRQSRCHVPVVLTTALILLSTACSSSASQSSSTLEKRSCRHAWTSCSFGFLVHSSSRVGETRMKRISPNLVSQAPTLHTSGKGRMNTKLSLFALNLSGKNRDPDDGDDDDDKDDNVDFPTWVKALRQWPLYPSITNLSRAPPPSVEVDAEPPTKAEKANKTATESIWIPLASLINVEALLMASGEETLDDSVDLELFATGNRPTSNSSKLESSSSSFPQSSRNLDTTILRGDSPLAIFPTFEELGNWDKLVKSLQKSISDLTDAATVTGAIGGTTDAILKEATSRLEYFVTEASTAISPATLQDLILRAGRAMQSEKGSGIESAANDLVAVAEKLAREQGLDVREAAERARETTKYTANLVTLANGVLVSGYALDETTTNDLSANDNSRPLFASYTSAKTVTASKYKSTVAKAAEMGSLSGAIYQDVVPSTLELGHAIVANGTTDNVAWLITDTISYEDEFRELSDQENLNKKPIFVRTITLRGFDASDEAVDREVLLNTICSATPETLGEENGVTVHSGLLSIARSIYRDVAKFVDFTAPDHRLVINGHSVGGSLSVLLLLLMTQDRGADWVRKKILRVYTFGSPPVAAASDSPDLTLFDTELENYLKSLTRKQSDPEMAPYECKVLNAFDLPSSIVYGYVQPWDPIVRLFTNVDPLYPLLGDLGKDGITLYASGPPRSLRPITRAIIESWEGWPRFRDSFRSTVNQNYTSVGIQHILLPEPIRYLSDRLVSVNVAVPPVDAMLRISSAELLPALEATFPLDVFRISFVPTAIRSFVHHFYPAYGFPIVDYASKKREKVVSKKLNVSESAEFDGLTEGLDGRVIDGTSNKALTNGKSEGKGGGTGWTAPQWLMFLND